MSSLSTRNNTTRGRQAIQVECWGVMVQCHSCRSVRHRIERSHITKCLNLDTIYSTESVFPPIPWRYPRVFYVDILKESFCVSNIESVSGMVDVSFHQHRFELCSISNNSAISTPNTSHGSSSSPFVGSLCRVRLDLKKGLTWPAGSTYLFPASSFAAPSLNMYKVCTKHVEYMAISKYIMTRPRQKSSQAEVSDL